MNLRHLFTVLFYLLGIMAYAGSITGIVVSQSHSDAVAGATVTLLHNDSIIIAQTQADIDGKFKIDSVPAGRNILRVAAMGYKPERIAILGGAGDLNVEYVFLTESAVNLNEVTVYGTGVIEKVDKYIVLPSKEEIERAGRSINLLGQLDLPGLRVNLALQTITVEDRTPVYQINGRQQDIQRILNLNPEDILRVEYSNIPGIRYLDSGKSGIINFILKKSPEGGGIFANLDISPVTGFLNGGIQGSYNYKKSQFILSYNTNWRDYYKRNSTVEEKFISDKNIISRNSWGVSPLNYLSTNLAGEYTYQRDINTMFNAKFGNSLFPSENSNNGIVNEINDGTATRYESEAKSKRNGYSPSLDLFFSKRFKNRQSIEFNAVGIYNKGTYDRYLKYIYPGSTELINNYIDNNGWAASGEAVYNKDFKKITTKFGVQYSHNYAKNEYLEGNQRSELVSDNTYVYGEIKGKIKKLSYSLGTGLKLFSIDNMTQNQTYIRNMTTANILLPLFKGASFNYIIMYKPMLPSLSQLSPVLQTTDNILQTVGNPDLKPSDWVYNRILLRYNNNKGFTVAFWIKYGRTFNPIVSSYTYNSTTKMFILSPHNENYHESYGLQLNLGYRGLFNHLNIFGEVSWNGYNSSGKTYKHNYNNIASFIEAQAYWGNWDMGINYTITPTKNLTGETISRSEKQSMIYIGYKYKDLKIKVSMLNAFNKDGFYYETESLSAVHPELWSSTIPDNGNMLLLGFSYNINFGKSFKKGRKTLNNGGYDSGMGTVE